MKENNWTNNPNLYGPGCALSASGVGFEPELFLKETSFPPELILFTGVLDFPEELKNKINEVESSASSIFELTFLVIKVSEAGVSANQHKEAMLFFKQYCNEILRLSKFPNVEQLVLRCMTTDDDSFENHPEELINLGFDCGLSSLM